MIMSRIKITNDENRHQYISLNYDNSFKSVIIFPSYRISFNVVFRTTAINRNFIGIGKLALILSSLEGGEFWLSC